ncbi:hypothetical protein ACEUAB_21095 [Aeromonas veronii]
MRSDFHSVIDIYESLLNADLNESAFYGLIDLTEERKTILNSLLSAQNFLYSLYDENDTEDEVFNSEMDSSVELLELVNGTYYIKMSLARSELGVFYRDIEDWLSKNDGALNDASFSKSFYIVSAREVSDEPGRVIHLAKQLCLFSDNLKNIADYHDEKSKNGNSAKLVFVIPTKEHNVLSTITVDTVLTKELFEYSVPDSSLVSMLVNDAEQKNTNAVEKLSVFKMALVELVRELNESNNTSLLFFIKEWDRLIDGFNASWINYLNGFSFHKLKAELEEQKISFAQKLSDAVLGLSGKMLTIPVSIGALSFFIDSAKKLDDVNLIIYFISTLVLCLTVRASIIIQQDCLRMIKKSYRSVFENRNKKIALENKVLAKLIAKNVKKLDKMFERLSLKIEFYLVLAWLPLLAFSIFYAYRTSDIWLSYYWYYTFLF